MSQEGKIAVGRLSASGYHPQWVMPSYTTYADVEDVSVLFFNPLCSGCKFQFLISIPTA